jgi:predicted permease
MYWMLTPIFKDITRGGFSMSKTYAIYCMYSILLVCISPFGILSLRFFLEDEKHITYASILAVASTVFSLYFTFKAAVH